MSPAQKNMLDWLENGFLVVGDRNKVFTLSGVYVGMRSTLMSLVALGLAERFRHSGSSSTLKIYQKVRKGDQV